MMFFNRRWITHLWFLQTMEYCSVIKRDQLSSHEDTEEGTGDKVSTEAFVSVSDLGHSNCCVSSCKPVMS